MHPVITMMTINVRFDWRKKSFYFIQNKNYIVSAEKRPLSILKNLQSIASFEQLQFKGMNISNFLTKLRILVKVSATVIEILTFNKLSTACESVTSTTSSRDSCRRSGQDLTTRSSVLQLLRWARLTEDILNTFYDNWWMITLLHWR